MGEPFLNQDATKWDQNEIEKTYTQFLKQILGVNRSTTTAMVRGELNRHSLQEEILRRNIKYAEYVQQKESVYFVKQAYEYELKRDPTAITFMASMQRHAEIHDLHDSFLPYADPYENLYQIDYTKLRKLTHELYHNKWKSKLEMSSKADTYRKFKPSMKLELYLKHQHRKERVALTKLRVSDHKLMIEEGRRTRPPLPRPSRVCYLCHSKVEDEIHFLTNCNLYGSLTKYWNQIKEKTPQIATLNDEEKFIFLMSQEDPELMKITLKMTYEWQRFRSLMCDYFYQP